MYYECKDCYMFFYDEDEHLEETHCIREWAEILGFSEHALRNRIRRGWNTERALTENVKIHRKKEII